MCRNPSSDWFQCRVRQVLEVGQVQAHVLVQKSVTQQRRPQLMHRENPAPTDFIASWRAFRQLTLP